MKDRNASAEPVVKPGLSPSRFVKVFMHGEPFGRKINLALHNNYDSLSFTLKKLGNNYSSLVNKEEDGAIDSDFDLLYDDMDGVRYFLGDVPWEVFTTTVKKIYIVPAEQQNENDYQEEEEDNAAAAATADEDGDGAAADDGVAAAADDVDDVAGYTSNDDPSFD
ncbi:putative auxin-responsive protein IAA29 isoform X1 [Oryza sativa Japonica Group]|uniref:putative auxin-responsive protein IAA29 isoform X1 n=1 Tax=Oryza sativa subsp. japonica TaxID=39947 RepID=UPI0001C7B29E|nr:putative auxin-responsive protein IAA29 isoform X2 [Oryza sativa Japonica Group]